MSDGVPSTGRTGPIPLRSVPLPIRNSPAPEPVPVDAVDVPVELPKPEPPAAPEPVREATVTGSLSAVDLFKHGQLFAAKGDHARAVHAFERAVKLAPDNVWLCIALGSSLSHLPGRNRQAEEALKKAVSLAPFTVRPYVALAQLYRRSGRFVEARAQLNHAFGMKPDDRATLDELAELDKVDKGVRSGLLKKILGT